MIDSPNRASREPVRGSGWVTALAALLTLAGVKLAGLDAGTAAMVAAGLAPALVGEVGRRLAFSPATVAKREHQLRQQMHAQLANEFVPTPAPARDPGWLRRYWPVGLAVAALAFVGPEAIALASPGDGGTLSEWTRDQLGTTDGQTTAGWWTLTAALAGFAIWFPIHLRKGWP